MKKLINAEESLTEEFNVQKPGNTKDEFNAGSLSDGLVTELEVLMDNLERKQDKGGGDHRLLTLLSEIRNEAAQNSNVFGLKQLISNAIAKLRSVNSVYVPQIVNVMMQLKNMMSGLNDETRISSKHVEAFNKVVADINFNRDNETSSYQNTPLRPPASGFDAYQNKVEDNQTMTKGEEPPKAPMDTTLQPSTDLKQSLENVYNNLSTSKDTIMSAYSLAVQLKTDAKMHMQLLNDTARLLKRISTDMAMCRDLIYNIRKLG